MMPTAVFALGGNPQRAPCLTDDRHELAHVHVHQDGSTHHRDGHGSDEEAGKCCGLFCLSAVSLTPIMINEPQGRLGAIGTIRPQTLTGRDTDRIDRPPRSLPSP